MKSRINGLSLIDHKYIKNIQKKYKKKYGKYFK